MRVPDELSALADDGVIDEVLRPLMSGKEAQVYLVVSQGRECVAKVYKDAQKRSFKNRADYTEGRSVRNSRDQRAMAKRSRHGREQDEAAWRSTEVDTIYRLQSAGVSVPVPYSFVDGVLVMELVTDHTGSPAPRLGDVDFDPREATAIYHALIQEVVRMLCAGVVHGDLSEFNVLLAERGPVVIDFPQAIDASKNQNARALLLRDVENLHRFHARYVPNAPKLPYAQEMWALFEQNRLTPDTRLSGRFATANTRVDTRAVMSLIGDANRDESRRRAARGEAPVQADRPQGLHRQGPRPRDPRSDARPAAPPQPPAVPPKARRVEIVVERVGRPGTPRARTELRVNRPHVNTSGAMGSQGNRTPQRHNEAPRPRGTQHQAEAQNQLGSRQRDGAQHQLGTQHRTPAPSGHASERTSQLHRPKQPHHGEQQARRSVRDMPAPTNPRAPRRPS
jgi:RIO kinase 1